MRWTSREIKLDRANVSVQADTADQPVSEELTILQGQELLVDATLTDIVLVNNIELTLLQSCGNGVWSALASPLAVTSAITEQSVFNLTMPTFAAAASGDYITWLDHVGELWAVSLDKTGSAPEPTGAAWVAVDPSHKAHVDISTATTAADVAALVDTALQALTDWGSYFSAPAVTLGVLAITLAAAGAQTATPVPHNKGDTGSGSLTGAVVSQATNTETLTIRVNGYDAAQFSQLPLQQRIKLEMTAGAEDSCTVTSVKVCHWA